MSPKLKTKYTGVFPLDSAVYVHGKWKVVYHFIFRFFLKIREYSEAREFSSFRWKSLHMWNGFICYSDTVHKDNELCKQYIKNQV